MKHTTILAIAACCSLTLISCQEKSAPEASEAEAEMTESSVEMVILKSSPENAKSIAEARTSPTPGESITIMGKVIGSKTPFVEGRAMVLLGDPEKLISCDLNPSDSCHTPWDVCCDDHDDIKNFTATIQVLDENGKLLKQGLKGVHGIKELSHLVITGTVAEGSNADNLLINATGIYVQP